MSDLCSIRQELDEKYHDKCKKQWSEYEACGERLATGKGRHAEGTCEGWYFDYLKCLDNHVAKKLFAKLK